MRKLLIGLFFLFSFSAITEAQKAKNMNLNLPSKTMPGRYFTKVIAVFPYYFNDTMQDVKLINSFKYLPPIKHAPYYVLSEKDSVHYAATVGYNEAAKCYTVTRFQPDGAVERIVKYDPNFDMHGEYSEFFPGKGYYIHGKYKHGKEEGEWKTFDKNGKLVTMTIYKKGVEVNTQIYTIPQEDSFTKKHKAVIAPEYTITPYFPPVKKKKK